MPYHAGKKKPMKNGKKRKNGKKKKSNGNGLTAKQKKLPPALQGAILRKKRGRKS